MMAEHHDDVAEARARLPGRQLDAGDRRIGRHEVRGDVDAAVRGAERQDRQRPARRFLQLDEDYGDGIGRRAAQARLAGRPQLRLLVEAEIDRNDPDLLELVGEACPAEGLQRRRQIAADCRQGIQRQADLVARDDGVLVQDLHGMTEQDLGVQVGAAIGAQQVVKIQRQGRVGDATAVEVARRQELVAEPRVGADPVEEQVHDRIGIGQRVFQYVRRAQAHVDVAAERAGDVGIHQAVVQDVAQDLGDAGDGKRGAHLRASLRSLR